MRRPGTGTAWDARRGRAPAVVLLALHADLLRGRLRRAAGSAADAAGLAAGGLAAALSGVLLLLAALLFGFVGNTLIGSLIATGRAELATRIAGLFADGGIAVALAAMALSDPIRSGTDPRPLSLLPLRRLDRALADVASLLALHPVALAIWPVALALLAAAGSASARAAVLLVPAASGLLLLAAAAALLLRRALAALGAGGRSLTGLALRGAVLAAPLAWLMLGRNALAARAAGDEATVLPSPGAAVAAALGAAIDGRPLDAALPGLLLHGLGLAALSVAAGASGVARTRTGDRRPRWRPRELVRIYGPSRAGALAGQGVAGAAVVMLIGAVAQARLGDAWPAVRTAACFSVWLLASSIAPIASNVLGLGAPAVAADALLPRSARRTLASGEAWALLPAVAAGVLVAGAATGLAGSAADAVLVLSLLAGIAAATAGAGSLCSVLWPWPVRLDEDGDPAWGPGPSRLVMTLGHGVVLAAAMPALATPGGVTTGALSALAAGLLFGAVTFAVASHRLERRRWVVTEALLR